MRYSIDLRCLSTPSEQTLEFGNETPIDPRRYPEQVGSLVYFYATFV